jgi:hypothetical protein
MKRKSNPLIKAINDQITTYKREADGYMNKMHKIKKDRMLIRGCIPQCLKVLLVIYMCICMLVKFTSLSTCMS